MCHFKWLFGQTEVFQVKEIRTEHLTGALSTPCLTALPDSCPLFCIAKSSYSSVKGIFSWDIQVLSENIFEIDHPDDVYHTSLFVFPSSLSRMSFLLLIFYPFNTCSPKEPGSNTLVSIGCFSWRYFDAIFVISNTFVCNADITGDLLSFLSYLLTLDSKPLWNPGLSSG